MNISNEIITELANTRSWSDAIRKRESVSDSPAVYVILMDKFFPRLKGETRVLYIGHTKCLGGKTDRARLYAYRYASGGHGGDIRDRVSELAATGAVITLHWASFLHKSDARKRENELLIRHLKEHLELPPFNGKV